MTANKIAKEKTNDWFVCVSELFKRKQRDRAKV